MVELSPPPPPHAPPAVIKVLFCEEGMAVEVQQHSFIHRSPSFICSPGAGCG